MSEWIKVEDKNIVRHYLPMYGTTFLALWKGQFCLASFDEDIDRFWLQMLPGQLSGDMEVSLEREGKFTHYRVLDYPKDY